MSRAGEPVKPDVTAVVITRDRRDSVQRTLSRMTELPGTLPIVLVDNASSDGTAAMVERNYPDVIVVHLGSNRGAVARNIGMAMASTELVALTDDDSWWTGDSLDVAVGVFARFPEVGLVAGKVLVGPDQVVDPTSIEMERGTSQGAIGPYQRIDGFLACGSIVRRAAMVESGGFDDLLFFQGEEEAAAADLVRLGWELVYVPSVVAHHMPGEVSRDHGLRRRLEVRNQLLVALTRRGLGAIWKALIGAAALSLSDADARVGLWSALKRLPYALGRRTGGFLAGQPQPQQALRRSDVG